jgi:hypothetical protein
MSATSTDVPREKAEGTGSNSRVTRPSNFSSDIERNASWEEWYKLLWKAKIARLKKDDRGVSFGV